MDGMTWREANIEAGAAAHFVREASMRAATSGIQIRAARYAFHCVVRHKYREAMRRDAMTLEEAQEYYRKAMDNFDQIVRDAGPAHAANEAVMAKGFGNG